MFIVLKIIKIITFSKRNEEKLERSLIFGKVSLFRNIIVEICNLKINEWHITAKRNFSLPGNIENNQSVVFSEFSDLWNNLAFPVFPKPWIPTAISRVSMKCNVKMSYSLSWLLSPSTMWSYLLELVRTGWGPVYLILAQSWLQPRFLIVNLPSKGK